MFKFSIINSPNFFIDKNIVKKIFKFIDKNEDKKQNGILNLVFVSGNQIKELNNQYRKINKETDVLSFHYYDDFSDFKGEEVVGELIFCEEKVILQGKEDNLGSEKEFYMLLIHSIFHILGYDHELEKDYLEMKEKEEFVWRELF